MVMVIHGLSVYPSKKLFEAIFQGRSEGSRCEQKTNVARKNGPTASKSQGILETQN